MRVIILLIITIFSGISGYAQFSLTGSTYSQDFDGLGTAATNNVSGGNLYNLNTSLDGWYFSEAGSNANTFITRGTGTDNTGDTYNFATGSTDRSLGGLQSGSLNPTFGFYFTNNTGSSITSLTITYTGETWRVGTANRTDKLDFQYSTSATSLTAAPSAWTDANTLDYQNVGATATGTTGVAQQTANISATISSLNITNGSTFFIRWTDFDATGSDDGMAINNFSFTTTTSTAPIITLAAQQPAGTNLSAASVNNVIAAYKLTATNNDITVSSASFITGGTYAISTDIANFKVWQNTSASVAGATLIGTNTIAASGNTINFNAGFTAIAAGTTEYLVITTDVASSPALSTVSIIADPVSNFSFTSLGGPVTKSPSSGSLAAGNTFNIAAQFQPGKLAVLRIGDGSLSLTSPNQTVPVAIMQFNTSGTSQNGFVASSLPTTTSGTNYQLTQNGASTSEGEITLSADGNYLTVVGYDAPKATTGVAASISIGVVVGRVAVDGTYNTTTILPRATNFRGSNARSGVTIDGTAFWLAGTSSSGATGGVRYAILGGGTPIGVASTPDNTRIVNIFKNSSGNNQLYVSSASGNFRLATVGTGTPITSGQTITNLLGISTLNIGDPYGYVFLDADPNVPGPDLLYVASFFANAPTGLLKFYSTDGVNWITAGSLTGNIRGITGTINCSGKVDLYITSALGNTRPTQIYKFTDLAAYNATITNSGSALSTVGTQLNSGSSPGLNYAYGGGITFTPLPDITINSNLSSSANTYRNITVSSGGTFTLTSDITVLGDVVVGSGAVLDCGAYHILKSDDFRSTFTLKSGGTLKTSEMDGIAASGATGAIQTCATRTYDIAANYHYTASGPQVTGSGLPATVNDLVLTNTSNDTLSNSVQVNGQLNIASGANLNINGKTLTLNGTIAAASAGTITGSISSNLAVTGTGSLTGNLKFDGSVTNGDMVNDFTINRTAGGIATMGSDLTINNSFTHTAGELAINGFTVTINKDYTATGGTFTGSISSNLLVAGSSGTLSAFSFTTGFKNLGNFAITRANGAASLGSDLAVNNYISLRNNATLSINGQTLSVNGAMDNSLAATGTLTGSGTSNLTIGGSSGISAGTLNFTAGAASLNTLSMSRTGVVNGPAAVMGNSLDVNAFSFTNGILATGNNLLTWNNSGGTLTAPNIPWAPNQKTHKDSYICLCTSTGSPLTFSQPYTGAVGFKVKNIGGTNTDTWFPVGLDFKSPNRMMINNANGSVQDFTVVLQKGDVNNTPLPSVKRTWYVTASDETNARASVQLYYTKQVTADFGLLQDEVEAGFVYSDGHLVQETYPAPYTPADQFVSNSLYGSGDIEDFISSSYDTSSEIRAKYTYGISKDLSGNTNGIKLFTRFSITNANTIILPVTLIGLKAILTESKVNVSWTSLNELNIAHYSIERSSTGNTFIAIGTVNATSSSSSTKDYTFNDDAPLQGNNFYRIKAMDKDGRIIYSNIVSIAVNTGKPGISIRPNPVKNYNVTLCFTSMPAGKYNITLYSTTGNAVFTQVILHNSLSAGYSVSLPASLAKGIYFINIQSSEVKYTQKIIIQ